MIADELGQALHDRATRGEQLSAEEQATLESWYEIQDNLESDILAGTTDRRNILKLQTQIETGLAQLRIITQRIQNVAAENEALRQDIVHLRRQLADSSTMQQSV